MADADEHIEVSGRDRSAPTLTETLPVTIVLDRLRSAYNVGNIFRLAEAVRAERIVTCGYTATPPHPKLAKTARGCEDLVPCEHQPTALDAVLALRQAGRWVCAVETVVGAAPVWDVDFHFPAALVFGNEALGISLEALRQCHATACLPTLGRKNSINVGNCAAVALFEALRRWRGLAWTTHKAGCFVHRPLQAQCVAPEVSTRVAPHRLLKASPEHEP